MAEVLGAVLSLCLCKLICSVLCLPAVKPSLSSVSLCCSCLLLFTDFTITIFLALLWLRAPWLSPLPSSSDVIALRFMLFLSETYGAVLLLTTPLVALETTLHLMWRQPLGMEGLVRERTGREESACPGSALLRLDIEVEGEEDGELERASGERSGFHSHAVGSLCCLLVWSGCGLCARHSWRREEVSAETCLMEGGFLAACLPSLFAVAPPNWTAVDWALLALALLLGLAGGLELLTAKLAHICAYPQEPTATCTIQALESKDLAGLQLRQTQPALCMTMNPAASTSHTYAVDSEKTSHSCTVLGKPLIHQVSPPHDGDPVLLLHQFGSCKLKHENVGTVTQLRHEHLQKRNPLLRGFVEPCESDGEHLTTGMEMYQHAHGCPARLWRWLRQRGSPCLRGDMLTGLLCGLLVCIFPVVLSANILLLSHLDTLVVYLLRLTPSHKHSTYETV